jgi:hypothetical protein
MSDTASPTKRPASDEVDGNGMTPVGIESPDEFYSEFTKRPDVKEILKRLAGWQPSDDEPTPRGG